nr:putative colanic acid biosynthesis acetyltransferase [uncultured Bacteroides sp.]
MEDNKEYVNRLPKKNIIGRALWNICSLFLFKPFPTKFFRRWRNFVLRLFGAKIAPRAGVYCSAKIQCPWNLTLKRNAWIGPHCILENDALIILEENSTVSQYSYLCTSSHDITHQCHNLIHAPITIGKGAWVAADSFVGMGVTIGEGAVVGARTSVFKDVEPWTVVGGYPAMFIKKRVIKE